VAYVEGYNCSLSFISRGTIYNTSTSFEFHVDSSMNKIYLCMIFDSVPELQSLKYLLHARILETCPHPFLNAPTTVFSTLAKFYPISLICERLRLR
jgi:hypothetical protein